MGIISEFEERVEDTFEGAANKIFDSPISPVQIAKKAERQMRREKMLGAGKQYAPTLYTVLVNKEDDHRLFGYYPTLAGETETYLAAKAVLEGLLMDGQPLVRFVTDKDLKRGKFVIIAELVAAPIIEQLRDEEMQRYGIASKRARSAARSAPQAVGRRQGFILDSQPDRSQAPEDDYDFEEYEDENFDDFDEELYGEGYDDRDFTAAPQERARVSGEFRNMQGRVSELPDIFDDNNASPEPFNRKISVPLPDPSVAFDGISDAAALRAQLPPVIPHTIMFAPGAGNANPIPKNSMVKASLLDTADNRSYDLATTRLLMGRDKSNDIVLDDVNASRVHAEICLEPQGVWAIADLGSTNGTLVNGREITASVLRDGDYITIGMTNLVFIQD